MRPAHVEKGLREMKIAVIGATGMIGARVVKFLNGIGHQTTAAALELGTNVLTGEGLADVLAGADALVDVTNAPTFEADAVMQFFTTSATNIVAAANDAGVRHYVMLSIVGAHGLPESGYMRGKIAQERIARDSGLPYTVVRATQFHEFTPAITSILTSNGEVRVPDALIQPIAADEVAVQVSRAAISEPVYGIVNIGGPDKLSFADMAARVVASRGDVAEVVVDPAARYFGALLNTSSLVTDDNAVLGCTRFADWLWYSTRTTESNPPQPN
jgi:uncharacterized protein YbjT (DUF2867 family)